MEPDRIRKPGMLLKLGNLSRFVPLYENLALELLLSLLCAAGGYAAAFVPLALRRVLAAILGWDPHPPLIWLLGSALLGLLAITMVTIGKKQPRMTRITVTRVLGRILFAVPALPFGFICLVMMAPHGILMLPHIWVFLCCLVASSAVGLLILWFSVRYDLKKAQSVQIRDIRG